MKSIYTLKKYILIALALVVLSGCEDMIEVDLPNSELSANTVYVSDITTEAAVNGIYQSLVNNTNYNLLHTLPGQTSDELIINSLVPNVYTSNQILDTDGSISGVWNNLYNAIYNANAVIEGIEGSSALTPSLAAQWQGEAYFLRAYAHFYLVNFGGEIPLILTTDIDQTAFAGKSSVEAIYGQIVSDLEFALANLPEDYSNYDNNRIRVNRATAQAFLARVHLYLENWDTAEQYATAVIEQTDLYGLVQGLSSDNSPFIADSREALWQLAYFNVTYAYEGSTLFTTSGNYLLRNGNSLFEDGDARKEQ
ncbi:RagB/SusD family nutrient uptake outer membrane protein [Fulvivirga maritima]|uniref:RagB/SusD family nutrient uptake outer membrane protein n=1 Tax=Fulvivirga maritima TaxID=2904247 RepID=UPI001F241E59|nr:RagB/SusD family nutrient uptake outer membrane protein [Fulvivirga maritima]UII24720.1 RagB/SusD family nutrient uptake outer membrane protein [Fulvivirga maritima]